jgi:hypothetical protein
MIQMIPITWPETCRTGSSGDLRNGGSLRHLAHLPHLFSIAISIPLLDPSNTCRKSMRGRACHLRKLHKLERAMSGFLFLSFLTPAIAALRRSVL